ncbi:MAG: cupin domain-containing protein [Candidatus Eremiobacteraeota bacterium]|nr:cupin domain-containing protein [Candidatus Eremiobacteraeota bacterium]
MTRTAFALVAFGCLLLATGIAGSADTTMKPVLVLPANVHWVAGTGEAKGTYSALVAGNPGKPGIYVMLIKVPAGWSEQPHFHATDEYATVIKGNVLVGFGDTFDKASMKSMPPGSVGVIPKGMHHYAMATTEAIFEVFGMGPVTQTYVHGGGSM